MVSLATQFPQKPGLFIFQCRSSASEDISGSFLDTLLKLALFLCSLRAAALKLGGLPKEKHILPLILTWRRSPSVTGLCCSQGRLTVWRVEARLVGFSDSETLHFRILHPFPFCFVN